MPRIQSYSPYQEAEKKSKFREAKETDLQKIAAESETWDDISINLAADKLKIRLDFHQVNKVKGLIIERLKEEQRLEQKQLDQKFQDAIVVIWASCNDCTSTDIRPFFSSHSSHSGSIVIGGPSNYQIWQTLDYLYCENCGRVFYNSKLAELYTRWSSGEFVARDRVARDNRNFC